MRKPLTILLLSFVVTAECSKAAPAENCTDELTSYKEVFKAIQSSLVSSLLEQVNRIDALSEEGNNLLMLATRTGLTKVVDEIELKQNATKITRALASKLADEAGTLGKAASQEKVLTTPATLTSSLPPPLGDHLLWINDADATVRLVDLSGEAEICFLPKYPKTKGPVTMTFSDSGDLVACGDVSKYVNKDCYSFNGEKWAPLPPLQKVHSPQAYSTRSFAMKGLGLWVGGWDGSFGSSRILFGGSGGMVQELFTPKGKWMTLPLNSPYGDMDYPEPCPVPLNNTHIFFSGGGTTENGWQKSLNNTWILDLENLAWTPSTPMLTPRSYHGCILTADGEVLVAGGGAMGGVSSVHIFNPVSQKWRTGVNLPSKVKTSTPGLLLWKKKILLLEHFSDLIWEMGDQGWQPMNVTMGARFSAVVNNAVLVPDSWRTGCN